MSKWWPIPVLAVLDVTTRIVIETQPGLMHPTPEWHGRAIGCAAVLALVIAGRNQRWGQAFSFVATGCVINTLDSLDGMVNNPISVHHGIWWYGFNVADAAIVLGATLACWHVVNGAVRSSGHHSPTHNKAA